MANIMSQIKLFNKPSRNSFDLSKRNIFSAKIGELLPVYCKEVLPGDNFQINVRSFTRTMPVNTAAFTRIKEYYDWFFVPTNLLWNKFNTFVTQMTDNVQHASGLTSSWQVTDKQPYFVLDDYLSYVKQMDDWYNRETPTQGTYNHFGFNRAELTNKLMDYLDYGDYIDRLRETNPSSIVKESVALNPFPLLAYQKIYSDYYRNSQWENSNAPAFNVDYLSGNDLEIDIPSMYNIETIKHGYNMFDLRYSNWHKDLFTGVLPNSQYGDAASVMLTTSDGGWPAPVDNAEAIFNMKHDASINQDSNIMARMNGDVTTYSGNSQVNWFFADIENINQFRRNIGLPQYNAGNVEQSVTGAFSILALRQAEALQRWKEITQSQQQDYKAQIEAHFGVNVSDAYSERCKWIDGFDNTIDINEVVNTNLVSNGEQQIADIAGKGVGVQDGSTSFSSQVHGYLMCIYHAEPLLDYSLNTRIARQNLKTMVTDYAIPELDKTGMVSVPIIEMTNDPELNEGQLLGYAPRYYDYKTDVDSIKGSLKKRNSAWVAPFDDVYLKNLLLRGNAMNGVSPVDYTFFKINPAILDPIFTAQIQQDNTFDISVDTDQLITNCYFAVKAVRNLDRDGLPY